MAKIRVTLLEPEGNDRWEKDKLYKFTISISAFDVPEGRAELNFDQDIFVLIDSVRIVKLASGNYNKEIIWYLKPIKEVEETQIAAVVAAGVVQAASAQIIVYSS